MYSVYNFLFFFFLLGSTFPYKNVDKKVMINVYNLNLFLHIRLLLITSKSPVHSHSAEPSLKSLCWTFCHISSLLDLISVSSLHVSSDLSSHSPLVSCWSLSCVCVLSLSAHVCWSPVRRRPSVCARPGWRRPGSWSPAGARQQLYPGRWAVCGQALTAGLQTTAGTPAWLQRQTNTEIRAAHVRPS